MHYEVSYGTNRLNPQWETVTYTTREAMIDDAATRLYRDEGAWIGGADIVAEGQHVEDGDTLDILAEVEKEAGDLVTQWRYDDQREYEAYKDDVRFEYNHSRI